MEHGLRPGCKLFSGKQVVLNWMVRLAWQSRRPGRPIVRVQPDYGKQTIDIDMLMRVTRFGPNCCHRLDTIRVFDDAGNELAS